MNLKQIFSYCVVLSLPSFASAPRYSPSYSSQASAKEKEQKQLKTVKLEIPIAHGRMLDIGMQQELARFVSNVMLIFLDNSEQRSGAITNALIPALQQKAAPILVSYNLFLNLMSGSRLSEPTLGLAGEKGLHEEINNRYNAILETLRKQIGSAPIDIEGQQKIVDALNKQFPPSPVYEFFDPAFTRALKLEILNFTPKDWIIKSTRSSDLILLIPRSLNPKLLANYRSPDKPLAVDAPLTPIELQLGIKIDHLFDMKIDNELKEFAKTGMSAHGNLCDYFLAGINQIFATRSEYANKTIPVDAMPRWAIYITGHGDIATRMVGGRNQIVCLGLDDYKNFLDFLDKKIVTRLLVLSSCYAVGTNAEKIYKDLKDQNSAKNYSFVIATEGLPDTSIPNSPIIAQLQNFNLLDIDFEKKRLRIRSPKFDFTQFVQQVTSARINFIAMLRPIFYGISYYLYAVESGAKYLSLQSLAQIKTPYAPWFAVLDAAKKIVSIGDIMAITRDKPLVLSAKTNVQVLLLYTSYVPFDLVIEAERLPSIVSMLTDNVAVFNTVFVSQYGSSLEAIIKSLFINVSSDTEKKFYIIEELKLGQDFVFPGKDRRTITNVVVALNADGHGKNRIYYTYNNDFYLITTDYGSEKLSSGYFQFVFAPMVQHRKNASLIKKTSFVPIRQVQERKIEVQKKLEHAQRAKKPSTPLVAPAPKPIKQPTASWIKQYEEVASLLAFSSRDNIERAAQIIAQNNLDVDIKIIEGESLRELAQALNRLSNTAIKFPDAWNALMKAMAKPSSSVWTKEHDEVEQLLSQSSAANIENAARIIVAKKLDTNLKNSNGESLKDLAHSMNRMSKASIKLPDAWNKLMKAMEY